MTAPAARVHPQQALAVYVESLASGARVAVFGDAASGVAERLIETGARSVDVYDPDAERARAQDGRVGEPIRVLPYVGRDPAARHADLVIVPELGLFDAPAQVVAFARALARDNGVAVIGAINRETAAVGLAGSFDYYELFELVAAEFPSVRMVAQLDFRGVALVALGETDDAPAVSVDTQLVEGDRPVTSFVALAGSRDVAVDPYAIVELPLEAVIEELPPETAIDDPALRQLRSFEIAASESARDAERRAIEVLRVVEERNEELQAELRSALDRQRTLELDLNEALRRASDLEVVYRDQELSIRALEEQAADLEAAVAIGALRLAEVTAELGRERETSDAARAAAAQLEPLARRAQRAEHRVELLEREIAASGDAHGGELLRFEEALRERGQALRHLEVELSRREQWIRELLASLEEGGAAAVPAPRATLDEGGSGASPPAGGSGAQEVQSVREENLRLQGQLDALALELARREGEAHAATWTVAELERKLAERQASSSPAASIASVEGPALRNDPGRDETLAGGSTTRGELSAALDEVDALRRALAQEHEARSRAESGEALRQARAEIQELTVMLEQIGNDRAPRPGASANPTAGRL